MDYGNFGYTYNKVSELISDENILNILDMDESYRPWLTNELFATISDQCPSMSMFSNERVIKAAKIGTRFYNASFQLMMNMSMKKLDLETLMNFTQQDRYCINAVNGVRACTNKEVEEAIVFMDDNEEINTIFNNPSVKLDDKEVKLIRLLTWAMTGRWRYYIAAGYPNPYVNGSLRYLPAHYIIDLEDHIELMCKRLDEGKCDDVIDKIRRIRKLGKYKYTDYAADEVVADVPISYVINQVSKLMTKNRDTILKRCFYLTKSYGFDLKKYSTEDRITMRKGYLILTNPEKSPLTEEDKVNIEELKDIIAQIKKGVEARILKEDSIYNKIAFTIASNNYRFCSDKQKQVLLDGIKIIENHDKNDNTNFVKAIAGDTPGTDGFGVSNLSSLLGAGGFGNGEFCEI